MHPLTCYAGQLSLCHAKIEKVSEKFFVMINKDGGGTIFGFLDFMGGDSCYEGEHRAHGASPQSPPLGKTLPGMAVFGRSAVVSSAFKTPFLIKNNNKNNRTMEKTIENYTLFSKTSSIKGRTLL